MGFLNTRRQTTTRQATHRFSTLTSTSFGEMAGHMVHHQPSLSHRRAVITLQSLCHLLPTTTRTAQTLRLSQTVLSAPDLEPTITITGSVHYRYTLVATMAPQIRLSPATSLRRLTNGILSITRRKLLLPSTSRSLLAQGLRTVR